MQYTYLHHMKHFGANFLWCGKAYLQHRIMFCTNSDSDADRPVFLHTNCRVVSVEIQNISSLLEIMNFILSMYTHFIFVLRLSIIILTIIMYQLFTTVSSNSVTEIKFKDRSFHSQKHVKLGKKFQKNKYYIIPPLLRMWEKSLR